MATTETIVVVHSSGDTKSTTKKVWLTFDDGPHPEYTNAILRVLEESAIRATFFVLGTNVARIGAEVLERIGAGGHCIGNHGYSHKDLRSLTEEEVRDEITRTEALICGSRGAAKVFRPPYGASSPTIDRVVSELGYRQVLWNVDTRDWNPKYQPDFWVERAVSQIRKRRSAIVLAHDIHKTTADHVGTLIERIGSATFCRVEAAA
jgi:peptidoglycan/xylan/chitin deacetylase (PgdA/CDA1 family)